jgi:hypothetical protein
MRRFLLIVAASLIVLANGLLPYAHWIAFQPGGSTALLSFSALSPLVAILAFCLLPLSLLLLFWRRLRRFAAAAAALLALHLVGFTIAGVASTVIRERGLSSLCERARPIVQALHAYESRTGHAPETLAALVPQFLAEIPKIGLGDEYRLMTGDEARLRWHDRSWALTLDVPSMWPFPEILVYLPDHNYDETVGGLRLRRKIDAWGLYAWD